jgi:two-component system sensor histidine kinase KdpD
MERVIANVTANALRYSPAGSPPLLRANARGGRVELRVVDHGPGVPAADRERMFVPFQRLRDTDPGTGVGLGLAVSRGLTEAMHGTLEPEETRGGGLTMAISVPAAPRPAPAEPARAEPARVRAGEQGRGERQGIRPADADRIINGRRARHSAGAVSRSPANSAKEAGV